MRARAIALWEKMAFVLKFSNSFAALGPACPQSDLGALYVQSSISNAQLLKLRFRIACKANGLALCVTGAWDTLHLCFVYGRRVQKRTSWKYGRCDLLRQRHVPTAGVPCCSLCGGIWRLRNCLWRMDCYGLCDHLHSLLLQRVAAGPTGVEKLPSS